MDFSRMVLYHATTEEAARKIKAEGRFRPGNEGFAGPAMYFSQRKDAACRKCKNGRQQFAEVLITCEVDVGNVVEAHEREMSEDKCRANGGGSVKIVGKDVWAIYDSSRITIKNFENLKVSVPLASLEDFLQTLRAQAQESDAKIQSQEMEQHDEFVEDYKKWGKGNLLGGSHIAEGDAASLRKARLAKFNTSLSEQSEAAKVPRVHAGARGMPQTNKIGVFPKEDAKTQLAEQVQHVRPARQMDQMKLAAASSDDVALAPQTSSTTCSLSEELKLTQSTQSALANATSIEDDDSLMSSQSHPQVLPECDEAEEDELQKAILLSMQGTDELENEELQRAMLLSMQQENFSLELQATDELENEEFQRAMLLSMQQENFALEAALAASQMEM